MKENLSNLLITCLGITDDLLNKFIESINRYLNRKSCVYYDKFLNKEYDRKSYSLDDHYFIDNLGNNLKNLFIIYVKVFSLENNTDFKIKLYQFNLSKIEIISLLKYYNTLCIGAVHNILQNEIYSQLDINLNALHEKVTTFILCNELNINDNNIELFYNDILIEIILNSINITKDKFNYFINGEIILSENEMLLLNQFYEYNMTYNQYIDSIKNTKVFYIKDSNELKDIKRNKFFYLYENKIYLYNRADIEDTINQSIIVLLLQK